MFGYLVLEGTEGAKLIQDICNNNTMMNESNLKSQVSDYLISENDNDIQTWLPFNWRIT